MAEYQIPEDTADILLLVRALQLLGPAYREATCRWMERPLGDVDAAMARIEHRLLGPGAALADTIPECEVPVQEEPATIAEPSSATGSGSG